jgi:hypothetical protein
MLQPAHEPLLRRERLLPGWASVLHRQQSAHVLPARDEVRRADPPWADRADEELATRLLPGSALQPTTGALLSARHGRAQQAGLHDPTPGRPAGLLPAFEDPRWTVCVRRAGLAVGALAGVAATVALGAAKPSWQTIPVGVDERGTFFGAGRAWFYSGVDSGNFSAKSARVAGGKLSGWSTAALPGSGSWNVAGVDGQELVFSTPGGELQAVKLLPNGRFGARRAFTSGGPPPAYSTGSSYARLPDRVVQLVNYCDYLKPPQKECRNFEYRAGACCDENGEAVVYASFVKFSPAGPPRLGLDRTGRLWLAWDGPRPERPGGIVQLDPKTLEPRGKPASPLGAIVYMKIVELVCSDVCRLVVQAYRRGVRTQNPNYTWAPGERALTAIRLPARESRVFAARAGPGRLELAFNFSTGGPERTVGMVGAGRSDPRGRNARLTSSLEVPQMLGSFATGSLLTIEPRNGVFGPSGFVTTAVYEKRGRGTVRAAVLPLR